MNELFRFAMEASIRAALVASCVGAILALARVRNGAVRHAAWTAVLCAMLLMPVLPRLTPGIALPAGSPPTIRETEPVISVASAPLSIPAQPAATPAQAPVRLAPSVSPPPRRSLWLVAALVGYLAIALGMLAHLVFGWRSAWSLVPVAEPVALPLGGVPVCQSAAVVTPLTIGVLKPRILLPCSWASWPQSKLRAVLAHEAAHVRRRDALVTLTARLNRCLFWFHPLAWWLERELAATAEIAADEAAVRAVGEGTAYAQVLLEMAEAVRRSGGRLAWEGVAMDGARLERRINRILRADFLGRISRKRKAFVAIGCAAAIFLAAACRDRSEVRQKLQGSNDVTMLLSDASRLVGMMGASSSDLASGKALIQRALVVQPDSTWARELLNMAADQEVTESLPTAVWQGPLESRRQKIEALPSGDRFRELANLAIAAGDEGVRSDVLKHDPIAEKAAWQQAGKYAQEALDVAPQARNRPDYGTAFFNANMVLGMAAVKAGDANTAAQYLLKAADAPATDALRYPIPNARPWAMNWHFPAFLASALLKAGEREAVVSFLERYSGIVVSDRARWLEDTALIRQGKLPPWTGR